MIKLTDILNEGKQVGVLYHFTPRRNVVDILRADKLDTGLVIDSVSLTRNYALGKVFGDVRFAIDGDKLSYNYKIEPFLHPKQKIKGGKKAGMDYFDKSRRREREEKVDRPIEPLSRYLIQIDFYFDMEVDKHSDYMQRILKWIPDDIPYNFVSEWKPVRI